MARDVAGLLDKLKISQAYVLGYSMGGAIAQELARQFPDRVSALVLCATTCGGPRAVYASPSVVRVMRELDGLTPEQIARRIWKVTYSPEYLQKHGNLAEDQMQREITAPTPLHAADLQFQAFAEFDGSKALSNIRVPTLVLTGDLDQLVSPENSRLIAGLIPGARLIIVPGCGHRVMWEATDECAEIITEFLAKGSARVSQPKDYQSRVPSFVDAVAPAVEFLAKWPWMWAGAGLDTMAIARQSIYFEGRTLFGDGKPIVLMPQLGSYLPFMLLRTGSRCSAIAPLRRAFLRFSTSNRSQIQYAPPHKESEERRSWSPPPRECGTHWRLPKPTRTGYQISLCSMHRAGGLSPTAFERISFFPMVTFACRRRVAAGAAEYSNRADRGVLSVGSENDDGSASHTGRQLNAVRLPPKRVVATARFWREADICNVSSPDEAADHARAAR